MSRKIADSIRRGLEQAVAFAKGEVDRRRYRVHVPAEIDVKVTRTTGLKSTAFKRPVQRR